MIRHYQLPSHLSPAQRNQRQIRKGDRLVDKTGKTVIFDGVRRVGHHKVVMVKSIWSQ